MGGIIHQPAYEFGSFRLEVAEGRLLRGDELVPLTIKAFKILLLLVQNRGHVIEKDEILRQIWPDSFVEEATLTQNIFTLRKALGDSHDKRRYIETIPKRGYRFVAEVRTFPADNRKLETPSHTGASTRESEHGAADYPINSLAILPLLNATNDPRAEYFSDSLTESIIYSLSQISQLRVMALNTVVRYKSKEIDAREVGRELRVGAVMVGRVFELDNKLIIRTELVDVDHGWQIWGAQFNGDISDIFQVEQEVTQQITEKLRQKLADEHQKRLSYHSVHNTEAYQLYLKGRYQCNKRTSDGFQKALKYFEQAIAIDPFYAPPHSGIADTYTLQCTYLHGLLRPGDAMPKAEASAMKALELDSTLAEGYTSLAYIRFIYDWDWVGAESAFKRAIQLNPRDTNAHQWYSHFLMAGGRNEESFREIQQALEIDHFDHILNYHLGWLYFYAREYDKALRQLQKALEMSPGFYPAQMVTGRVYLQKGNYSEAIAYFQKSRQADGVPSVLGFLGYAFALSGERNKASKLLNELRLIAKRTYVAPTQMALVYTGLGEHDRAFEWLSRAYKDRNEWMCYLKIVPEFESLRADPRFVSLMQRVGLAQ